MLKGACNCSAVQFEISASPQDIYVCHCSICRKFTGGMGMPVVIVKNEHFKWCAGEQHIKIWQKPDADWQSNFCSQCGSPLPGKNDDAHMFIPAGLLPSHAEGFKIAHHLFVGSKPDWDEIAGDAKQHEDGFRP